MERGGFGVGASAGIRRLEREPASFTDTLRCTVVAETPETLAGVTSRLLAWNADARNVRGNVAQAAGDALNQGHAAASDGVGVNRKAPIDDVDDAYGRVGLGASSSSSSSSSAPGAASETKYDVSGGNGVERRGGGRGGGGVGHSTTPTPAAAAARRLDLLLAAGMPSVLAVRNGFSRRIPALRRARSGYRDMRLTVLFSPTPLLLRLLGPLCVAEAELRAARPGSLEAAAAQRDIEEVSEWRWCASC